MSKNEDMIESGVQINVNQQMTAAVELVRKEQRRDKGVDQK